jgi:hypothetical protein
MSRKEFNRNIVEFYIYSKKLPEHYYLEKDTLSFEYQYVKKYDKIKWSFWSTVIYEEEFILLQDIIKNKGLALLNIKNDSGTLIRIIAKETLLDNEIELVVRDE